jgi:hypothetical protein
MIWAFSLFKEEVHVETPFWRASVGCGGGRFRCGHAGLGAKRASENTRAGGRQTHYRVLFENSAERTWANAISLLRLTL